MTTDTPTSVEQDGLGDWRIQAASRLKNDLPAAYPGGLSHKAGSIVLLTTTVATAQHLNLGFTTPSAAALALSAGLRSAERAASFLNSGAISDGGSTRRTEQLCNQRYRSLRLFRRSSRSSKFEFPSNRSICERNDCKIANRDDRCRTAEQGSSNECRRHRTRAFNFRQNWHCIAQAFECSDDKRRTRVAAIQQAKGRARRLDPFQKRGPISGKR